MTSYLLGCNRALSLYKRGYGRENMGGVVFHELSRINLETCDG
jgi:hypothetical protein